MTTPLSVFSLIVRQTADQFFDGMLAVARLVGLPVSTWRVGDPTRTTFRADSEAFETLDGVAAEYAKAGFLDTAEGPWLTLRASDVYGVTRADSTASTPSAVLTNSGGGFFQLEPGALVLGSTAGNVTFTNQALVTINPGASVSVLLVCQSEGSDGTVAEDQIDLIVSPPLLGVAIASSTAAIGTDETSDPDVRTQCRATLGALSPDGPADAYEFVARNADLTTVAGVTRARADGDNTTGTVTLYVATATAALDAPSIALVQAAVDRYATPLCTDCTVVAATPQAIPVTLTLTPSFPGIHGALDAALVEYFAGVNMGGVVARSAIDAVAHKVCGAGLVSVSIAAPASNVSLGSGVFPIVGTVTAL